MRPGEVLHAQMDLLDRSRDKTFRQLIDTATRSDLTGGSMERPPTEVLSTFTRMAHAYRVTHDMCEMVEWLAGQSDEAHLDRFYCDLAPTPYGFVCFDKPLVTIDRRGRTMLTHWLVWGQASTTTQSGSYTSKATAWWTFNDPWRQPDEIQDLNVAGLIERGGPEAAERITRIQGRFAYIGINAATDQMRLGPALVEPSADVAAMILSEGDTPMPGTNTVRQLHALWSLLNQTVTSVVSEKPERQTRRRAERVGIPGEVSVIALRRSEGHYDPDKADADGSGVQWRHRWIVRQHWRWQPYGPRSTADEHEHTYGEPHVEAGGLVRRCVHEACENHLARIIIPMAVKGPEDAPFKQTEKVYSLER